MPLTTETVLSRARSCIRIEEAALRATAKALGREFVATARAVFAASGAGRKLIISDDALGVDALRRFETHEIDDLIVVDARRKPVGLVDSQDLPRFRIM